MFNNLSMFSAQKFGFICVSAEKKRISIISPIYNTPCLLQPWQLMKNIAKGTTDPRVEFWLRK